MGHDRPSPGWRVNVPRTYGIESVTAAGDVNGDALADLRMVVDDPRKGLRQFIVLGDRSDSDATLEGIDARG